MHAAGAAFSRIYDRTVLGMPFATLGTLLLILAVASTGLPGFRLDASADSLLLDADPQLKRFREFSERFGSQDYLFVTVSPTTKLLAAETLDLLRTLRRELDAVPGVASVVTLLDVPLVRNSPLRLADVARDYRTVESAELDRARAMEELTESPLYRNLVVSADGRTTAIRVDLAVDPAYRELQSQRANLLYRKNTTGLSADEAARLDLIEPRYQAAKDAATAATHTTVEGIRTVIAGHQGAAEIHLGGLAMIADDMIAFVRSDIIIFGLGALALAVVTLGYLFRELRWVMIPIASCVYCTVVVLGILGAIGWKITVISSNFLALNLILAISMNIHLIVRYRETEHADPDAGSAERVRRVTHDMARPCFYTSLTSLIGFASLAGSDIRPVADFGWMMAMSIIVTYLVVFSLVPTLMSLTRARLGGPVAAEGSRFTFALARLTDRHGRAIIITSAAIAGASAFGIGRLEVENSFINYFRSDTEIYRGMKLVDRALGGTTPLDIVLKFEPDPVSSAPDSELDAMFGDSVGDDGDVWFTPAKIERIKMVHDYVSRIEGVGKVMSLAPLVEVAEALNGGEEFDAFALNVIYKRIPETLKAQAIAPYVSIEHDQARVSLRILDSMPGLKRAELIDAVRIGLKRDLGLGPDEFEITGLLVLYTNMLQSLYASQIGSVGGAMAGVLLTLYLLFRNLRAAVIGVIPNALAAAGVLGFMGWSGIPLDMMTIMIAALTMGIAVEDCIHYLYRFRLEQQMRGDSRATMYACHASIARAGFYTTLVVCFGFSILMLSHFIPSALFGLLTTVAMSLAILAALTLMPKLLLLWRPFELRRPVAVMPRLSDAP